MTVTDTQLRERIETLLTAHGVSQSRDESLTDLLGDGYGYALGLDSERVKLEQRITELAARAEEPGAASELRTLWLRHRTIVAELAELRTMLRELREQQDYDRSR
jgi:hypothetical protein